MGYSIAGLIIKGQIDTTVIEALLKGKIKYLGEVDFEDAVSNCHERDTIDILKNDVGALIITEFGQFSDTSPFKGEFVQFIVSEPSDTYYLEMYVNGNLVRKYFASTGEIIEDFGKGVTVEADEDFADLIWILSGEYLGGVPLQKMLDWKFKRYGLTLFMPTRK